MNNNEGFCIINPGLPTECKYGYKFEEDGLYFYGGKVAKQVISKSLFLDIIKAYKLEIKAILEDDNISTNNTSVSDTFEFDYKIFGEECYELRNAVRILSNKVSKYHYIHKLPYKKIEYLKILDIVEVTTDDNRIFTISTLKDFALFLQQEEFKELHLLNNGGK